MLVKTNSIESCFGNCYSFFSYRIVCIVLLIFLRTRFDTEKDCAKYQKNCYRLIISLSNYRLPTYITTKKVMLTMVKNIYEIARDDDYTLFS